MFFASVNNRTRMELKEALFRTLNFSFIIVSRRLFISDQKGPKIVQIELENCLEFVSLHVIFFPCQPS